MARLEITKPLVNIIQERKAWIDNYLMNTPLNPFSPSWDPQANAGAQGAAMYNPASLNL